MLVAGTQEVMIIVFCAVMGGHVGTGVGPKMQACHKMELLNSLPNRLVLWFVGS